MKGQVGTGSSTNNGGETVRAASARAFPSPSPGGVDRACFFAGEDEFGSLVGGTTWYQSAFRRKAVRLERSRLRSRDAAISGCCDLGMLRPMCVVSRDFHAVSMLCLFRYCAIHSAWRLKHRQLYGRHSRPFGFLGSCHPISTKGSPERGIGRMPNPEPALLRGSSLLWLDQPLL